MYAEQNVSAKQHIRPEQNFKRKPKSIRGSVEEKDLIRI
jgi:hypothetical protein